MGGFGDLAQGIGFIGQFVPGVGTAVALGTGALVALDGPPDALVPNPYAQDPYAPRGALWGIRKSAKELVHTQWSTDVHPNGVAALGQSAQAGPEKAIVAALNAAALRRGDDVALVGKRVIVNELPNMTLAYNRAHRVTGLGVIVHAPFVPLDSYNRTINEWKARIRDQEARGPEFAGIDVRPWSEAAEDEFHDAASVPANRVEIRGFIAAGVADWKAKRTPAARAAFDAWTVRHDAALELHARTKAEWLAWKEELRLEAERAQAEAQLVAEFNAVWTAYQQGQLSHEEASALAPSGSVTHPPMSAAPGALAFLNAQHGGAPAGASRSSLAPLLIGAGLLALLAFGGKS